MLRVLSSFVYHLLVFTFEGEKCSSICYSFKRAAIGFRDELIYKMHNNICVYFLKNNFL